MPTATKVTIPELAALLRPSLLRLTRQVRNQRVDPTVTLGQLSALAMLNAYGPMSAGELAKREHVQPPSMTKTIGVLESHGLLARAPHPDDKRQSVITITEEGVALLEEERKSRTLWLTQRVAELTPEERATILAAIPVMDKLAGPRT
jgi:DNA-binding MarR family transcriptional regulator